jgi:hypothetical protein
MSSQEAAPAIRSAAREVTGTGPRVPARWLWLGGYAVASVVLFCCYFRISSTQTVTSDGATFALQARDMLHGNWLLSGWTLSDVSYYTTEIPEYMLVVLLRGFGPSDVHVAAAITYTLLVVLAGLVAKGSKRGQEGLIRVLIASGIMIAPQIGPGALLLVLSPDHAGTGVPVLLILLVLDRAPRHWGTAVLTGVLLAWAVIADQLVVTIVVLPLVAVCVARAYQGIVMRREPWRARAHEFQLAVAALAAVEVAAQAVRFIRDIGGYQVAPLSTVFAGSSQWPSHLAWAAEGVLAIFGADITSDKLGLTAGLAVVHLAGLALAVWALCRAFRRFFLLDDLIVQVIAVGIVVNLAAYILSLMPVSNWSNREIVNVLPFGAVLAGRLLAGHLTRIRMLPALAAVGCCYLLALGYYVSRPSVRAHDQALTTWLTQHHLTTGLGSYAEGNSVVLDSGGAVRVYAPGWFAGRVVPGFHEAKASDFNARLHNANFVVTTHQDGSRFYIPTAWVTHAFGTPAHVYHYYSWTILTWRKNLLAELTR